MKTNLDELRRLQGQISTKATERSTLFTLQQQQYAALSEENEGKVLTGTLVPNSFPIEVDHCFVQILMRN